MPLATVFGYRRRAVPLHQDNADGFNVQNQRIMRTEFPMSHVPQSPRKKNEESLAPPSAYIDDHVLLLDRDWERFGLVWSLDQAGWNLGIRILSSVCVWF